MVDDHCGAIQGALQLHFDGVCCLAPLILSLLPQPWVIWKVFVWCIQEWAKNALVK